MPTYKLGQVLRFRPIRDVVQGWHGTEITFVEQTGEDEGRFIVTKLGANARASDIRSYKPVLGHEFWGRLSYYFDDMCELVPRRGFGEWFKTHGVKA